MNGSVVHYTAFDDGAWACGGAWPEPVSQRPYRCGPDYPRVTTDPRQVTCEACKPFCAPTGTPATPRVPPEG